MFSHHFQNHMKHLNTRTVRNAVLIVKADGTHGYHYLKGSAIQNASDELRKDARTRPLFIFIRSTQN
jgi:hypothetical protein